MSAARSTGSAWPATEAGVPLADLHDARVAIEKITRPMDLADRRRRAIRARAETIFTAQARVAIRALRQHIQVAPLARAIQEHGAAAPLPMIPFALFAARLKRDLLRTFRDTYEQAGDHTADQLKARLVRKDVSFSTKVTEWGFDVLNTRGLQYLQQYAAQRVTQITEETRDAMRTLLAGMHQQGIPPYQQAQRIKAYVGLTEPHAQAVENLRTRLTEDGTGSARIDALVARKVRELTDLRGMNIGRTEGAFASTAGRREGWEQAADDGLIDRETVTRVWRTSEQENVCPTCGPMDGQESAGLDGTFTTGDGDQVEDAPVHPSCNCDVDINP